MAQPKDFAPVKLICGVIYKEDALYRRGQAAARGGVGERSTSESPAFPFDLTGYYEDEMGGGLSRRFMSFESLVPPESLPAAKLRAIELEEAIIRQERGATGRPVNIDPGYLTAAAFVMATAKDFAHRIPLGRRHLRPSRVPVHPDGRQDARLDLSRPQARARPRRTSGRSEDDLPEPAPRTPGLTPGLSLRGGRRLMARSFLTISGSSRRTTAMSSSVLARPSDIRIEDRAISGRRPMARRTCETSSDSSLQADPVET